MAQDPALHEQSPTEGYHILERFLSKMRSKVANSLIPDELRKGMILDIGCGIYPYFLINTVFSEKHGLDKIEGTIDGSSLREKGVSFRAFDLAREERLPYESDYFDVVTMLAVFEHIEPERLVDLLAEVYRTVKPEGVYIITTPSAWTDPILRVLSRLKMVSPLQIEDHKDKYTHGKIASLLEKAGFEKEKMRFGHFELFMNLWVTASK
jgi:SAM-dependent methyltransferase